MDNLKSFQSIIGNGKVNKTKAIIIALLNTDQNVPTIKTPDEYTNTLKDVLITSLRVKKQTLTTYKN